MTATTDSLIDALVTARRRAVPAHSAQFAAVLRTQDDAYAVQAAVAAEMGWFDGGLARHWKSGGPSRTATLGHSPLPPTGVWTSPAQLGVWPFHLGGLEAEIALRLAVDVDADLARSLGEDEHAIDGLVDAMCVSIELVDSRWAEGFDAPSLLRLADLQCHGALVLSDWVPYARRDWSVQQGCIRVGTQAPFEWTGTHTCGDPAFVLPAWLRHATRDGGRVAAGTVVTTGTWCGLSNGRPGEHVVATFDGIGEASVTL